MSDLHLYRAVCYCERALGMDYAPRYALRSTAELYQVQPGQLAELLLAKVIECTKARAERASMLAHDGEIDGDNSRPRREHARLA